MDTHSRPDPRGEAPPPRPITIDLGSDSRITLSPRLADPRLNLTERVLLDELFDAIDLRRPTVAVDLKESATWQGADVSVAQNALLNLASLGLVELPPVVETEFSRVEVVGISIVVNVIPGGDQ